MSSQSTTPLVTTTIPTAATASADAQAAVDAASVMADPIEPATGPFRSDNRKTRANRLPSSFTIRMAPKAKLEEEDPIASLVERIMKDQDPRTLRLKQTVAEDQAMLMQAFELEDPSTVDDVQATGEFPEGVELEMGKMPGFDWTFEFADKEIDGEENDDEEK